MTGSPFIELLRRVQRRLALIWQRHKRWLRPLLQATILLACLFYLAFNFRQIQQYQEVLRFQAGYLLGSLVATFVALGMGALGWGFVLRSMGMAFPWPQVSNVHLSSNLAKYLPGYGWQLVGKVVLTTQLGAPTKKASLAMLAELAILFLCGGVLAAAMTLWYPVVTDETWRTLTLLGGAVAILLLLICPRLLPIIGNRFWDSDLRISPGAYWTAVTVIMIGWIALALSFWLMGAALMPIGRDLLPLFIFALVASFLISLTVLFIPGGIGVRESAMVFFLAASTGSTPAVILAAVSRIIWLLCELAAAGAARLWLRMAK